MEILLPALGVAFVAFCVWLTVRIVNRRERWAKWTLAGVVGVLVLYVLSVGPAQWVTFQEWSPDWCAAAFVRIYAPVIWLRDVSPEAIRTALDWYGSMWQ